MTLPGGIILITSKLLQELKPTPSQLAAFIGHEMGHIFHRHSLMAQVGKNFFHLMKDVVFSPRKKKKNNPWSTMLGHIKKKKSPGVSVLMADGLESVGLLKFRRRNEYCADSMSWDLLSHKSNKYNPRACYSLLSKLHKLADDDDDDFHIKNQCINNILESLSTHPEMKKRMNIMYEKWLSLPYKERLSYARKSRRR